MADKQIATQLVHSDYVAPADFGGLNTGIHHASTVTFPNVAALRARDWKREDAYTYGLHGTPTAFTLAHRIAEIEGGRHTVLAPSGLAAILAAVSRDMSVGGRFDFRTATRAISLSGIPIHKS